MIIAEIVRSIFGIINGNMPENVFIFYKSDEAVSTSEENEKRHCNVM
jgi:hypothetical protein